jgi:hypothetical protein
MRRIGGCGSCHGKRANVGLELTGNPLWDWKSVEWIARLQPVMDFVKNAGFAIGGRWLSLVLDAVAMHRDGLGVQRSLASRWLVLAWLEVDFFPWRQQSTRQDSAVDEFCGSDDVSGRK